MSTHVQQRMDKLQETLNRIAEEATHGTPILVEGRKDAEALMALGIRGKIVAVKARRASLSEVAADVRASGTSEVILLLDHDRRGKESTARLKNLLEHEGIAPNAVLWAELFSLVGRDVKDVEGLATYMETLKSRLNRDS